MSSLSPAKQRSRKRDRLPFSVPALGLLIALGGTVWSRSEVDSGLAVRVRAEPSEFTIGDLVHVVIEVDHAPHLEVTLPEFPDSLGPFEVRSVETRVSETEGKQLTSVWDLTVLTFETGEVTFPALEVTVTGGAEGPSGLTTEALVLEVQSVLPENPEDILDIKSPRAIPRAWWTYWPWLAGCLALALALWWLARRRTASDSPAGRPLLPAHEEALAALRALEVSDLLSVDHPKPYYTRVSDILRRYLWRRFGIVALEATTSEIVDQLTRPETGSYAGEAGAILRQCDLVKFARLKPPRDRGLAVLSQARELVEESRPRETPEEIREPDRPT